MSKRKKQKTISKDEALEMIMHCDGELLRDLFNQLPRYVQVNILKIGFIEYTKLI